MFGSTDGLPRRRVSKTFVRRSEFVCLRAVPKVSDDQGATEVRLRPGRLESGACDRGDVDVGGRG